MSRSKEWHRARKAQISIVRSALIAISVLTAGLVLIILFPVRGALQQRDFRTFSTQSELVAGEVAGFLEQAQQLAMQLPSRTRIREELVAYLRGERSLGSYVDFTKEKLADAVNGSPGMVGAYRFAPDTTPLVGVVIDLQSLPVVTFDDSGARLQNFVGTVAGEPALYYTVPIHHQGFGVAGYDLVALSMERLVGDIGRAAANLGGAEVALATPLQTAGAVTIASETATAEFLQVVETDLQPPASVSRLEVDVGGTPHLVVARRLRGDWFIVIAQERGVLYASARRDAGVFALVILGMGILAMMVTGRLLRLLSRRTLAETDELGHIVEEQTKELQLMLREVHHRVKNDLLMLNSFLTLKAEDTDVPEAQEVLAEAQKSLLMMGRVYELLQRTGEYAQVDVKAVVEALISQIRSGSREREIEIHSDIDDMRISPRIAVPVAIMVNELVTNSTKYSSPGGDSPPEGNRSGGHPGDGHPGDRLLIDIALKEADNSRIALTVRDNGRGFPERVLRGEHGFGLQMVTALSRQCDGTMDLSNEPQPTVRVEVSSVDGLA